jgi:hypothetical protein
LGCYFWLRVATIRKSWPFSWPVTKPGGAGTHTRDTRAHRRAHGSHRRTSQPSKPTNTPAPVLYCRKFLSSHGNLGRSRLRVAPLLLFSQRTTLHNYTSQPFTLHRAEKTQQPSAQMGEHATVVWMKTQGRHPTTRCAFRLIKLALLTCNAGGSLPFV